jgi:hypothetical protein
MKVSANTAINAHCIPRLRKNVSERINAEAAKIPNKGNAIDPYEKTNRLAVGRLTSMPSKMEPNLTAAKPSQQNTTRKTAAIAHVGPRA